MALCLNLVGILGGFRVTPGFLRKSGVGVVSGDLVPRKAFAQIANGKHQNKPPFPQKALSRFPTLSDKRSP